MSAEMWKSSEGLSEWMIAELIDAFVKECTVTDDDWSKSVIVKAF